MFFDKMKKVLASDFNEKTTENLAKGYRTTESNLVDLNFAVASFRSNDESTIINMFSKAFYDNRLLGIKWLFYARDIREGLGERRLFRVISKYLANSHEEYIRPLIHLIGDYGRYDDLLVFLHTPLEKDVISYIKAKLDDDIKNMEEEKEISLLAKWLPSITTSSKETVAYGKKIAKELGYTQKEYRQTLSSLRKYLDVVEVKMSSKQWDKIKYKAVPSKANLIYNRAFLRNDEERRIAFLEDLKNNKTKINASILFPHEIVHNYIDENYFYDNSYEIKYDETLEQLWKNLASTDTDTSNTLVVADGSGSMYVHVGNSSVNALSVANALAIYFAERAKGQFNNKYITFSENPVLVDLSKGNNLKEKIEIAMLHNEVANTNIEKVFKLILKTGTKSKLSQNQMPKNIIIISDMEFDDATTTNTNIKLFEGIEESYRLNGYKLPRLIFWNVNSRSMTIPVKENDLGVALVSGFSINTLKMVLTDELDPHKIIVDALSSERYNIIEELLKNVK